MHARQKIIVCYLNPGMWCLPAIFINLGINLVSLSIFPLSRIASSCYGTEQKYKPKLSKTFFWETP